MTVNEREAEIIRTFATLADSMVAGFDAVDLLQTLVERSAELLDATDAGILLADGTGRLEVVASTDERSQLVELMQLGPGGGPCVECFTTGIPVAIPDISAARDRWADFCDAALAQGFHALHAVPLRLREKTIGSLNLFRDQAGELGEFDLAAAQALADVATIGILQERAVRESDVITQQLQRALDSRVIIEQAKGVVAYVNDVPVDEAFRVIREYARDHQRGIVEVAADIVQRRLTL
ncbi:GAF and ANTAR domain-containing protein [Diaminobutyricibacter tongyongensis]|uniref:GAF and ANTAR domain-containing protein n=1 Tax=Leifsonia tongyongensis TaxID=1268043 RepID=A0A6L9XV98_9MICO|nr:GAF and ANTAR domain-containing protein [Diaminobutyricibacter tongyongensis]NEN05147.1 GAF and ANTAR domain-containing protein [Diaminobutyricibacter tongyongensis]